MPPGEALWAGLIGEGLVHIVKDDLLTLGPLLGASMASVAAVDPVRAVASDETVEDVLKTLPMGASAQARTGPSACGGLGG
mmetsp:Transcript_18274/g.30930  ORF Transcript_18274/g.30930 Transcript_18274/m.30930 type:complete len:81 (-) Transcript_18274:1421-1663(-)